MSAETQKDIDRKTDVPLCRDRIIGALCQQRGGLTFTELDRRLSELGGGEIRDALAALQDDGTVDTTVRPGDDRSSGPIEYYLTYRL